MHPLPSHGTSSFTPTTPSWIVGSWYIFRQILASPFHWHSCVSCAECSQIVIHSYCKGQCGLPPRLPSAPVPEPSLGISIWLVCYCRHIQLQPFRSQVLTWKKSCSLPHRGQRPAVITWAVQPLGVGGSLPRVLHLLHLLQLLFQIHPLPLPGSPTLSLIPCTSYWSVFKPVWGHSVTPQSCCPLLSCAASNWIPAEASWLAGTLLHCLHCLQPDPMGLAGQLQVLWVHQVCAIFCKQPLLYRTLSVISKGSSSFLSPASSSMDWAMLTSLSQLLSKMLSWVSAALPLGLVQDQILSVVVGT